jgi:hypothetical protein
MQLCVFCLFCLVWFFLRVSKPEEVITRLFFLHWENFSILMKYIYVLFWRSDKLCI